METSEFRLGVATCLLSNQKTPFFLTLKWQYECLDLLGVGVSFSGVVGVLAVADIPASASQSAWASVRLSVGWRGRGASVRRFYAEVEIRSLLSLDPFPTAGSSRIFHICSWILSVWHSRRKNNKELDFSLLFARFRLTSYCELRLWRIPVRCPGNSRRGLLKCWDVCCAILLACLLTPYQLLWGEKRALRLISNLILLFVTRKGKVTENRKKYFFYSHGSVHRNSILTYRHRASSI